MNLGLNMASVTFGHPTALALLIAAVGPAAIAYWGRRRGRSTGIASIIIQTLAVALAAVALAQPTAPIGPAAEKPYLVLTDISPSVRMQSDKPLPWPADLPRQDYVFSETVAQGPAGKTPTASSRPSTAPGGSDDARSARTFLDPALRLALARGKDIAGVVIRSDGQWQDDWTPAAMALGQAGVRTVVVPMQSPPADARVAELSARRLADGRVAIRVTAVANAGQTRRLKLTRQGSPAPLLDRELTLLPDDPATFSLTDTPPADAVAVYRARLSGGDAFPENDQLSAAVLPLKQSVAVVAGSHETNNAKSFQAAIQTAGVAVTLLSPEQSPHEVRGWEQYAAVLLVDPTGTLLPLATREALAKHVRSGGGLVLLGAGPGASPADREDPLNSVAALVPNPYQRKPLRLIVVLDASGSMAESAGDAAPGQVKFDQARQAVMSLQRHLTARDSLEVIQYSNSAQVVYDSGAGKPDFPVLGRALGAIRPSGPTAVLPALDLATERPTPDGYDGLVLLVSDLLTEPYVKADVDRALKKFLDNKFKLSIVSIASPGETPSAKTGLQVLAEDVKAQIVTRESLAGLAEVFEQFLRQARGEPIRRGTFPVRLQKNALGLPDASLPDVTAYILCGPQPTAEVLGGVGDDPILGRIQAGLGRSISIALPVGGADNAAVAAAPQFQNLLRAAVQWAQRPGEDPRYSGNVRQDGERIALNITAADAAGPMNLLKLTAGPIDPEFRSLPDTPLMQAAPGRYQAALDAPSAVAGVVVRDDSGRILWQQGLGESYSAEFAAIGANFDNLRRLAQLAGGRVIRPQDLESLGKSLQRERSSALWPALLTAAVLLMLIDWCGTRILRR